MKCKTLYKYKIKCRTLNEHASYEGMRCFVLFLNALMKLYKFKL